MLKLNKLKYDCQHLWKLHKMSKLVNITLKYLKQRRDSKYVNIGTYMEKKTKN